MFHEKKLHEMYDHFYNFNWQDQECYANYLAQSYYYVNHSTKTLALAAGYMPTTEPKVFNRMVKHISEEMNHEVLCDKDLQAMNKNLHDYPESPATQALYQAQYYKIQHENPKSYFGYIYVLESLCCMVLPKVLEDKLKPNYPKQAINFLRIHADEDPGHLEQAKKVIASFSDEDQKAVADNMLYTIDSYKHFLTDAQSI